MANNYTLGRGELHFARFATGTQTPLGELYFGNSPEFSATIETENLDHYNSDRGVREKDASIVLETNRTGSFITDNISAENLSLFFFGSVTNFTDSGATVTDEAHASVEQGRTYQLGVSDSNPVGASALEPHTPGTPDVNIVVTDDDAQDPTTFVEGTDYTIDMMRARLYIVPGGGIANETNLKVSYKTATSTRERVISGQTAIEGALRYLSFNPQGKQYDWYMPYVKLTPNGEFALKGDDWQQIPFSVEILKLANREAIYINGEPLVSS